MAAIQRGGITGCAELVAPYRRAPASRSPPSTARRKRWCRGPLRTSPHCVVRLAAAGTRCKPLAVSRIPLTVSGSDPRHLRARNRCHPPEPTAPAPDLESHGFGSRRPRCTQPLYWRRHVREAVRFGDGLRTLKGLKPDCIVEIGPHPTLVSFASATYGDEGPTRIASLRKGSPDTEQILDALASLYLARRADRMASH